MAAPGVPAPRQDGQIGPEEVRVVSLLGSEPYALKVWIPASTEPAVPRLAVLVAPPLSPQVQIHLGRTLTEVHFQGPPLPGPSPQWPRGTGTAGISRGALAPNPDPNPCPLPRPDGALLTSLELGPGLWASRGSRWLGPSQ